MSDNFVKKIASAALLLCAALPACALEPSLSLESFGYALQENSRSLLMPQPTLQTLAGQDSKSLHADYPSYAGQGTDITAQYAKAWEQASSPADESELENLRRFKVLLVPGFLGNVSGNGTPLVHLNIPGMKVNTMFADQQRWLAENGVETELVPVDTEASPAANAKVIAGAIRASQKRVILLARSKGGIDSLYALVRYPDLSGNVAAFISVETPYLGSPVADAVS
ncbi:MAG TPA: hypothetical protein PLL10_03140, partial [Elusimicrobiales bacterium]|nr:hypothetical protein [Elusimicrobiales bacterium]